VIVTGFEFLKEVSLTAHFWQSVSNSNSGTNPNNDYRTDRQRFLYSE